MEALAEMTWAEREVCSCGGEISAATSGDVLSNSGEDKRCCHAINPKICVAVHVITGPKFGVEHVATQP